MSSVNYTALRNIISGHTSGVAYDFDFNSSAIDDAPNQEKEVSVALDGSRETTEFRHETNWSLTSGLVQYGSTTYNQWLEFLNSVRQSEAFELDPYGTAASPDNPVTVTLAGWSKAREGQLGYFRFSFSAVYVE